MSNQTEDKPDEQKPQNSGPSPFDQMVRRQVQRQRDQSYTPGSVGLYDPATGRQY